ncbi:MAG: hypothetical protein IPM69_04285 [Ignavibacteria bacterium]|nr:hypothetical protein [Ignavibacteria bacterium]
MKKIWIMLAVVIITSKMTLPVIAQKIEIGLSPFAAVWSIPKAGPTFNNAFGILLGVAKTDSSALQFQVRYDYFPAELDTSTGYDNSFHSIGIGVGRRLLTLESFAFTAFASVGFTSSNQVPISTPTLDSLTKFSSLMSKAPSSVTLSLGLHSEWLATHSLAPILRR